MSGILVPTSPSQCWLYFLVLLFSPNFCSSGPQIEDWCFKQSLRLFLLPASAAATWHSRRLCLVGKLTSSLWCWWHGSSDGQCISPLRCRCHVVLCKNKNSNVEPILDKAREVHIPCCFYFSYSLTWCRAHLVSTGSKFPGLLRLVVIIRRFSYIVRIANHFI
jgi:hypothetical protein